MRKTVLLLASLAVAMLLANLFGCGQTSPPREEPKQNVATKNNEGLSREEEKELSQRLEELEEKVEAQEKAVTQDRDNKSKENSQTKRSEQQQGTEEKSSTEGQTKTGLVQAVEDYYQAADRDDWAYTYEHLDSQTQAMFTEEEWYMKNQWFADTYPAPLSALDVQVNGSASDPVVSVTVYRGFTDGSSQTRNTYFLIEDGVWKHRFGAEEIDLFMPEASYEEFVAAQQGTSPSSASASASPTASVTATAAAQQKSETKHVKVVVTSDVPVDVSITDDNFDVSIAEQITGSKTYEFDVAADSGLMVDAMNQNMTGNVSIKVYEDGKLKTQDSDSSGYAVIMY